MGPGEVEEDSNAVERKTLGSLKSGNGLANSYQLLEDLTVIDRTKGEITFPAGEIVKIFDVGFKNGFMISQETGGHQMVTVHDPNLEIVAREIVTLYKYGSEENEETALANIQRALQLTRNDLLFVLASLHPSISRDDYQHLNLAKLADLHGSDRDKAPLQAIRAERALRKEASKIFYEKFGKDRGNKIFDATVDGTPVYVVICPGPHGDWRFEIFVEIEGKKKAMQWNSSHDGLLHVSSNNNYHDADFLKFFGKQSPEHLFNHLMEKLPAQGE